MIGAGRWACGAILLLATAAMYAAALAPSEAQKLKETYPELSHPRSPQSLRFMIDPTTRRERASDEIEGRFEFAHREVLRRQTDLQSKEKALSDAEDLVQDRTNKLNDAQKDLDRIYKDLKNVPSMPQAQQEDAFEKTNADLSTAQKKWTQARKALDAALADRDAVRKERDRVEFELSQAQDDENRIVTERKKWLEDVGNQEPDRMGILIQRDALVIRFRPNTEANAIKAVLSEVHQQPHGVTVRSGVAEIGLFFTELIPPTAGSDAAALERLHSVMEILKTKPSVLYTYENVLMGPTYIPAAPPPGSEVTCNTVRCYNWFEAANRLDGTSGARLLYFPEAWNFADAIRRRGNASIPVGMIDLCYSDHDDLTPVRTILTSEPCPLLPPDDDHGNHVAGIIAAEFNSHLGVDGGTPFAHLSACSVPSATAPAGLNGHPLTLHVSTSPFDSVVDALKLLGGSRVINVSLGYNWVFANGADFDPETGPHANRIQDIVRKQGHSIRDLLKIQPYSDIVIVSAAGNDCDVGFACTRNAQWTSPFNWAGLDRSDPTDPPAPNVLVVQADESNTALGRLMTSNVGGTISAPGQGIVSTSKNNTYAAHDGTSMAAPQITALVALMLAYNSALRVDDVRRILNVGPNAGTPNAFHALVESRPADFARDLADLFPVEHPDGVVDMQDFEEFARRVKDYERNEVSGNFQIDQNGDGVADTNDRFFPRADLNGDGFVSSTRVAVVPGFPNPVTDLDILRSVFVDTQVKEFELPARLTAILSAP